MLARMSERPDTDSTNDTPSPLGGIQIVVVGGGAAGFFAAIAAAEANPKANVTLLEKSAHVLAKVRISGGGRCNVTQACFDARELSTRYPRGGRALIGPLTRFGPSDTIEWFESRGVKLKTEPDGRMFPVTDSSQTIIDCLMSAARKSRVRILTETGLKSATPRDGGGFSLTLTSHATLECDRLLWAGGGCKPDSHPATQLGHTLLPPVPSLFTFHVNSPWIRDLAGISLDPVQVSVPGTNLKETGPVLCTHAGLSGPAILRLSAWGARKLHDKNYHFDLHINWLPKSSPETLLAEMQARRDTSGAQTLLKSRWNPLPARLWEQLIRQAGITDDTRWAKLSRASALALAQTLSCTKVPVTGKSMNKEEFVTCGGIPLPEVDFKTMQSRLIPGLYFAGEALDIDGITGGYNFQNAWTTGWIAGRAMGADTNQPDPASDCAQRS